MPDPPPTVSVSATPELELLLLLARTTPSPAATARLEKSPATPVDWNRLEGLARKHGVAPLVYRSLSTAWQRHVPQDTLDRLGAEFRRTAWRNLEWLRELRRLLDRLHAAGIPTVVHKGPVVAQMAYGDPGLRPYGDLDLLIPGASLNDAVAAVTPLGYEPLWQVTDRQRGLLARHGYHFNLVHQEGHRYLELHWRPIDPCFAFALPEREMWNRRCEIDLGPYPVSALCPEDQLLYLCAHGTKHFWTDLKLICDVAELVRRQPNLDWSAVVERATSLRAERILFLGLRLAEVLLGAPVPPMPPLPTDCEAAVARLLPRVLGFLALEDPTKLRVPEMTRFHLALFPTLPARLRYLQAVMAPKELDVLSVPLPPAFSPLYLLLRPLRLLRGGRAPNASVAASDFEAVTEQGH
jgi:hypothetical protein